MGDLRMLKTSSNCVLVLQAWRTLWGTLRTPVLASPAALLEDVLSILFGEDCAVNE
jgi:hypothetical protein